MSDFHADSAQGNLKITCSSVFQATKKKKIPNNPGDCFFYTVLNAFLRDCEILQVLVTGSILIFKRYGLVLSKVSFLLQVKSMLK